MAKKLIFPIFFIFIAAYTYGQRFDGGAVAGLNACQVEGDYYKGYNKPGLAAGFYVQTDLSRTVFSAFEIKYSQKGARKKPTTKDPIKYIMRLSYIDLPLYIGFRFSEKGSLIAGFSSGFLLSGKEYDNNGEFEPQDQVPFNTFDLEPLLGLQWGLTEKLKADLRFALSVLPVRAKPNDTNYYWQNAQFNNVITLALYYQISR